MAFVIRSERDIKLNTADTDLPGPGEYYNKTSKSYIKKKGPPPIAIPFNTSSNRTDLVPKGNNPGPGAYHNHQTSFTHSNDFRKSIDEKDINHQTELTISNHNPLGFLTCAKRFIETSPSLTDLPRNDTQQNDSLNLHYSTSSRIIDQHSGHIIKAGNHKVGSSERVVSIPSKKMFGYNFTTKGEVFLVKDPDDNAKLTGEKNNSVGPGHYELERKWDRNVVQWKKDYNEKNEKPKNIKSLEQSDWIDTSPNNNNAKKTKPKMLTKNYNCTQSLERRQYFLESLLYNKVNPVNELIKEKISYDDTPGPGFYTKEYVDMRNVKTQENLLASFGGTSVRFKDTFGKKVDNEKIGPGSYFGDRNKFIKEINRLDIIPKIRTQSNEHKEKEGNCVYMNRLKKNNRLTSLGPGQYNTESNLIKKEISKISKFGSIADRFKVNDSKDKNHPAPGSYFTAQDYHIKKAPVNHNNEEIDNNKRTTRLTIPRPQAPPVGSYSPGIIHSIEYEVSSKINPHQSQLVSFNTNDKRLKLYDSIKTKLGPGMYTSDNNKPKDIKQAFSPFNQKDQRFKHNTSSNHNKNILGPGDYDQSSPFDWKKKSYNVLFISNN